MSTYSPSRRRSNSTCPPRGVNFAALISRLPMTCASRTLSPATISFDPGNVRVNRWPASSSSGLARSQAASIAPARSRGTFSSVSLPRVMREMSRKSSTSRINCSTWRDMTRRRSLYWDTSSGESSMSWSALCSGASGLRSSWARSARKSSLRWAAMRKDSCALWRSASCRLSSWMLGDRSTVRSGLSIREASIDFSFSATLSDMQTAPG